MVGRITRPVRELKAFDKIKLQPGESKLVSFTISKNDFSFYNQDIAFVAEPGEFKVYVGGDSQSKNEAKFVLR